MKNGLSRVGAFFDEVRRRKVARTGLTYAVVVWVVWQVVDVVSPALGWSDRVLSFVVVGAIALAPLVLALAWAFEIRPEVAAEPELTVEEPAEPTRRLPSTRVGSRSRRPTVITATLPAAMLSAAIAWGLWPASLHGVGGFTDGDPTLISRCVNETDDPGLDGVLNTALEAVLGQSMYVSITSREHATIFARHYLSRADPIVIDRALANELGVRWGFKLVIHCALRPVGNAYQVSATLTDPQVPQDLAVIAESVDNQGELVGAIDLVASRTREALGESLESVEASKPLEAVTTPSLEALKLFTAATEAELAGDRALARQLFFAAADQDTLFARAHAAIGSYLYWEQDGLGGADRYRKALRHPDRISEGDRIWIEASWAASRGDYESAIGHYREYLEHWPDNPSAWYNLGTQHFRLRRCDEAGEAFGRVLAVNPAHYPSQINLAACLSATANSDSALVHFDSAFAIQPNAKGIPNLNHEYGFTLVRAGRIAEAEELFGEQAARDGDMGASGQRSAALLHLYSGRYGEALALLDASARRRQALGQTLSEYRDRLYLAGVHQALGRNSEADEQLDRVHALLQGFYVTPSWLYYAVHRLVTRGRIEEARGLLARAEADTLATSASERASTLLVRAEIEAATSEPQRALENARLALELWSEGMAPAVLCRMALHAGTADEAQSACWELISGFRLGWEIQEPTLLTYFWLGRLAEREGDLTQAAELYGILVERWQDADQGLVFRDLDGTYVDVLSEARTRLAMLTVAD